MGLTTHSANRSQPRSGSPARPARGRIDHVHRYEFDPQSTLTLSRLDDQPDAPNCPRQAIGLEPGVWILAVRLRSDYQLAAFVPVVKVVISETGDVSYEVYEGEFGVKPSPRPPEP